MPTQVNATINPRTGLPYVRGAYNTKKSVKKSPKKRQYATPRYATAVAVSVITTPLSQQVQELEETQKKFEETEKKLKEVERKFEETRRKMREEQDNIEIFKSAFLTEKAEFKKQLKEATDKAKIIEWREVSNVEHGCSICLDDCKDTQVRRLNCGHTFHFGCISRWLVGADTCPVCRGAQGN